MSVKLKQNPENTGIEELNEVLNITRDVIKISVRRLVEFILRNGDIDSKKKTSPENAMAEGARIHRMIQNKQGFNYHAEVPLYIKVDAGDFDILVEGRADGIIIEGEEDSDDFSVTIDEIKGIYKDIFKLEEPFLLHAAQAKVYGAIYAMEHRLDTIKIRMTYCNLETEQIRYFTNEYKSDELIAWFYDLVDEYKKWANFSYQWKKKRQLSIKSISFPYEYRDGQKELTEYVYRTIYHKKRLYIEAPTGVGKTIATIFPTLKAIGEQKADIMFYLTAKTITATVAAGCFNLLREKEGLLIKTVQITAKEKMCLMEECNCDPSYCPYAKGHYDRVNEAMYDLLNSEDEYMRDTVIEYANKHMVCPFEFCLDMSLFSDAIICDYNYLFDPDVYLRRFFAEGNKGDYVFLVDEAHNLVDRARDMYSAEIVKEDILAIKKIIGDADPKLTRVLNKANKEFLELKRECDSVAVIKNIDRIIQTLTRVQGRLEDFMDDDESVKYVGGKHDEVLDFFFALRHFLNMSDTLDESYVIYTYFKENGDFALKLFCIHPANHIKECLQRGVSTVFFSATVLPIDYYMNLLTDDKEDYAVYAHSSFDPSSRGVFVANDVSSKYTRRGPDEYKKIADYIINTISKKAGNYMVFFPSYKFMEDVRGYLVSKLYSLNSINDIDAKLTKEFDRNNTELLPTDDMSQEYDDIEHIGNIDILTQGAAMGEKQREAFLECFVNENKRTLIGLCVLGGIFSEGIDLKNDSLIGAIIVGTGLPQICTERDLIKNYFDQRGQNGFDFAYRYPGINKVLQAAGRVIRTADDVGVVLLLDERFLQRDYKESFPREWIDVKYGRAEVLDRNIETFWKSKK